MITAWMQGSRRLRRITIHFLHQDSILHPCRKETFFDGANIERFSFIQLSTDDDMLCHPSFIMERRRLMPRKVMSFSFSCVLSLAFFRRLSLGKGNSLCEALYRKYFNNPKK